MLTGGWARRRGEWYAMAVFSTFRVDVMGRSRKRRLTRRILVPGPRAAESTEPCEACARDERVRAALAGARARRFGTGAQPPRWD
ncbi:MAG: hypothetical protein ACT4QG_09745 [Sporichthyaceae bacterium]